MPTSVSRGTAVLFSSLLAIGGSAVLSDAQAASASSSGVYIVAPKWWGWCPDVRGVKNSVRFVSITNLTTGYAQSDGGDDIGWTTVRLRNNNEVHVNVGCSLGHGSTGTVVTIKPTRHKQTFYTSPSGGYWGN